MDIEDGKTMDNMMRDHVEQLGRHGAVVITAAGKERLSGAFYDRIVRFCQWHGINGIAYEIRIPETDEPMRLLIWRDGHVDSGSVENIRKVMDGHEGVFA